jgi:hypothetical protein
MVVMVTVTGAAGPPEVRLTVAGLTLQDAPGTVAVGLKRFMLETQVRVAVPVKVEELSVRL